MCGSNGHLTPRGQTRDPVIFYALSRAYNKTMRQIFTSTYKQLL